MRFLKRCLFAIVLFTLTGILSWAGPFKINELKFDNSDRIIFINSNQGDETPTITKGVLTSPDRVYFDITNAQLTTPSVTYTLENSVMSEVTISQFSVAPDVVRIVIKYNKNKAKQGYKEFELKNEGNTYFIKYNEKIVSGGNFSNIYTDNDSPVAQTQKQK